MGSNQPDADDDTVNHDDDNCPIVANLAQSDFDNDDVGDDCDPDDDNDGLDDADETTYGTNPFNADTDADTLPDGEEVNSHGTNPAVADTDSDGYDDGEEISGGSDPLDDMSVPVAADGDLNQDGVVDAADIAIVSQILSGSYIPDVGDIARADAAPLVGGVPVGDGDVDIADLLIIMRKATGILTF